MFEGVRDGGNADLHVTSTGCDDPVAVSLCGGALGALSLHGFKPENAHPPRDPDERVVLIGGGDELLRRLLREALDDVDLPFEDTGGQGEVGGDDPCNIVNRTLRRKGAQLELSEPLRETCSARTPGRSASTPPPRCSGPSWPPAATRSTGSRPSRRSPARTSGSSSSRAIHALPGQLSYFTRWKVAV
jgi:phage replication-related protein YjqB (UPF0714/DUF867 family)